MKFTTVLSLLTFAAVSVSASGHRDTNAARMARGLPPMPPVRRSKTFSETGKPSGQPSAGNCNVEKIQCCNSVTHASDSSAATLASLLGLVLSPETAVGITCSPLSAVGIGGNSCNAQPVCCENNNFNGLIAVGCSPSTFHFLIH
ncbi:fungal hydrophobin [Macrolepiota fuliginosa MF-IS2]|uniref:Hydrophobin n=1 Tax=Macrolepiota fuliginosa MF-IS2 TaxID=1400762 RepID=A0A9P6C9P4_9AGAR|nr:fungal hydrophobin [Macrolepiota fuliginosa MF-IS2]